MQDQSKPPIPVRISQFFAGVRPVWVFVALWVTTFVVYLPAAQAGRVGDFPGWVHFLNSVGFVDYLNRSESGIPSMYQFTQLVTYVFYKLFGSNASLWHLLFVTMHAVNAAMIFALFRKLFSRSVAPKAGVTAFCVSFLFCVCPHVSEVVVWEPAFHYLLGLMLMLGTLLCAANYLEERGAKYAWRGGFLFFLSTYSLEVFYLTPLFVFSLALYHRWTGGERLAVIRTLKAFVLPEVIFFAVNILLLRTRYHEGVAHITAGSIHFDSGTFSKAAKYVFHIVFLGRYFRLPVRTQVYGFLESRWGLVLFYGLFIAVVAGIAVRAVRLTRQHKPGTIFKTNVLLFSWAVLAIGLILPLWFPPDRLVIYDRYLYVPCVFADALLVYGLSCFAGGYLFYLVFAAYAAANLRFTHKVNAYWQQSAHIVNSLVYHFPNDPSKKVLLLSLPECLDGVQMIGSRTEGEFAMMYDALMPNKLPNGVYDVEAFFMQSPQDGANVTVLNDSTARVILNQWGTWWLFYGFGATSYTNAGGAFRVDMKDEGRYYDIILQRPAGDYLLLFSVGDQWRIVDWNKKNVVQE